MELEVLVATTGQRDFSKVSEMNIESPCILANQNGRMAYEEKEFPFGTAKLISSNTRGVGRNRNIAFLYSQADILLMADDDLVYKKGYQEIVLKAFHELPQADGIIFNVVSNLPGKKRRTNNRIKRIRFFNALHYGAVRLAVRRKSISRENISFNLNFGGGTAFSAGEDTLFICDMLKRGLKIYSYPATIATVNDTGVSSWFRGYNEKYYYDQGVITRAIHRVCPRLMCLQFLIRHPNYTKSGLDFKTAYRQMLRGMKNFRYLTEYADSSVQTEDNPQ